MLYQKHGIVSYLMFVPRYSRPPRRPILQAFCSSVLFKKLVGWDTLLGMLAIPMFMIACVGQTDGFVDSYACMLPFMLSSDHYFDCCNGLLLFVRREQREALPHYYFVCNTTTRQCIAIPNPRPRTAPFAAAIAYDPAKSPHYKVVRFIYFEEKNFLPGKGGYIFFRYRKVG